MLFNLIDPASGIEPTQPREILRRAVVRASGTLIVHANLVTAPAAANFILRTGRLFSMPLPVFCHPLLVGLIDTSVPFLRTSGKLRTDFFALIKLVRVFRDRCFCCDNIFQNSSLPSIYIPASPAERFHPLRLNLLRRLERFCDLVISAAVRAGGGSAGTVHTALVKPHPLVGLGRHHTHPQRSIFSQPGRGRAEINRTHPRRSRED